MGEQAQGEIVKWGFMGLMVLMVVIMANDVTALVTGKLDIKKRDATTTKDKGGASKAAESSDSSESKTGESANSSQESNAKAGSTNEWAPTDDKSKDSKASAQSKSK
jgi:hypothetical protein